MSRDVDNFTPYYDNQTLDEKKTKKDDGIVEITPDGQQTITRGVKEPLKKDPKKKKTIYERWSSIKKSITQAFAPLDNSVAIAHADDILGGADGDQEQDQMAQEQQGAEQPTEEQTQDQQPEQDQGQEQPQDQQDQEGLYQSLADHGYTDEEIHFIMSGHAPHIEDPQVKRDDREHELNLQHKQAAHEAKLKGDEQKQTHAEKLHEEKVKAEAQRRALEMAQIEAEQMRADELHEHDKKEREHEIEHKKRLAEHEMSLKEKHAQHEIDMAMKEKELELSHKKRMLDLEYRNAQKEAELDLEMAKYKMQHDLKQAELDAEMKREMKEHQHTVKLKQAKEEAKNPEKKDK